MKTVTLLRSLTTAEGTAGMLSFPDGLPNIHTMEKLVVLPTGVHTIEWDDGYHLEGIILPKAAARTLREWGKKLPFKLEIRDATSL